MKRHSSLGTATPVLAVLAIGSTLSVPARAADDLARCLLRLRTGGASVQEAAAKELAALSRTADESALLETVPALLSALKERSATVRKSLCTALTRIALRTKDQAVLKSMLEPLKATKRDPKTCVRCHGAAALGSVATGLAQQDEPSARYALRTLALGMKGKGGHSVIGSARVFGRIAPRVADAELRKDVLDFLRQATQFPDKGVAREAANTLKTMEDGGKPE